LRRFGTLHLLPAGLPGLPPHRRFTVYYLLQNTLHLGARRSVFAFCACRRDPYTAIPYTTFLVAALPDAAPICLPPRHRLPVGHCAFVACLVYWKAWRSGYLPALRTRARLLLPCLPYLPPLGYLCRLLYLCLPASCLPAAAFTYLLLVTATLSGYTCTWAPAWAFATLACLLPPACLDLPRFLPFPTVYATTACHSACTAVSRSRFSGWVLATWNAAAVTGTCASPILPLPPTSLRFTPQMPRCFTCLHFLLACTCFLCALPLLRAACLFVLPATISFLPAFPYTRDHQGALRLVTYTTATRHRYLLGYIPFCRHFIASACLSAAAYHPHQHSRLLGFGLCLFTPACRCHMPAPRFSFCLRRCPSLIPPPLGCLAHCHNHRGTYRRMPDIPRLPTYRLPALVPFHTAVLGTPPACAVGPLTCHLLRCRLHMPAAGSYAILILCDHLPAVHIRAPGTPLMRPSAAVLPHLLPRWVHRSAGHLDTTCVTCLPHAYLRAACGMGDLPACYRALLLPARLNLAFLVWMLPFTITA